MLQPNCKLKIYEEIKMIDDENDDEHLKAQYCWNETNDDILPVFEQFLWS